MISFSRLSVVVICSAGLACRSNGANEPSRASASTDAPARSSAPTPSPVPAAAAREAPAPSSLPVPSASPSSSEAPEQLASGTPLRVVVIGDSLSDPRVGGGGYVKEALAACSSAERHNLARGGWMVNQMRRGFERAARAGLGSVTYAVVFGGVNDVYSDETAKRTTDKVIADLDAIYALADSLGAKVIALTIAPWGGFSRYYTPKRAEATRRINAWIVEQARSGRIAAAIDANALLACGDPERLCPAYEPPFRDGLHFGPNGHAVLGRALAPAFASCR